MYKIERNIQIFLKKEKVTPQTHSKNLWKIFDTQNFKIWFFLFVNYPYHLCITFFSHFNKKNPKLIIIFTKKYLILNIDQMSQPIFFIFTAWHTLFTDKIWNYINLITYFIVHRKKVHDMCVKLTPEWKWCH